MKQLSMYEHDYLEPHIPQGSQNEAQNETNKEPAGNITEIIVARGNANPIEMVLPMLTHLSQEMRWLAWVNPPVELCRTCKQQNSRLKTDEIMLLKPSTKHSTLELARKALAAGTCHAVVVWADQLTGDELEILEQASALGDSHGIILRGR